VDGHNKAQFLVQTHQTQKAKVMKRKLRGGPPQQEVRKSQQPNAIGSGTVFVSGDENQTQHTMNSSSIHQHQTPARSSIKARDTDGFNR